MMMLKIILLMVVATCLALPVENADLRNLEGSQDIIPNTRLENINEDSQIAEGKGDEDLKTDSNVWFGFHRRPFYSIFRPYFYPFYARPTFYWRPFYHW